MKTDAGKTVYNRQRLTRIAEGRKAVKASTEAQRAHIIERYRDEVSQTPLRRKMYQEAVEDQSTGSMDSNAGHSSKRPNMTHKPSSSISSIASAISSRATSPKKYFFGKRLVEPPLDDSDDQPFPERVKHFP